jgi:hypothetical protein
MPVPGPLPGEPLSSAQARALAEEPGWAEWRPFRGAVVLPRGRLRASRAESFPGTHDDVTDLDGVSLKPRAVKALVEGFRYMALFMHVRSDERAGAVAGDAFRSAQGRVSPVAVALAQRELWRLAWLGAPLPEDYLATLQGHLETLIIGASPDARVLPLALSAAEGLAREQGFASGQPGLPAPETLALDGALRLAERVAEDVPKRRKSSTARVRAVSQPLLSGWLDLASPVVVAHVARTLEHA